MKRIGLLLIILLTLIVGLTCQQEATDKPQPTAQAQEAMWQDATAQRHQQQAVFVSSRQSSRIANTRPQRLLPSQGARHERPTGKLPIFNAKGRPFSLLKHTYGQFVCRLSAPCRLCLARDYYVIALRHIIR